MSQILWTKESVEEAAKAFVLQEFKAIAFDNTGKEWYPNFEKDLWDHVYSDINTIKRISDLQKARIISLTKFVGWCIRTQDWNNLKSTTSYTFVPIPTWKRMLTTK